MTDEIPRDVCEVCGENAPVAGRFATRCSDCLEALFGADSTDLHPAARIIRFETPDGRAERYTFEPIGGGEEERYRLTEWVQTKSGEWRAIGGDEVTSLSVHVPDDE